jgi:hypothetical protein
VAPARATGARGARRFEADPVTADALPFRVSAFMHSFVFSTFYGVVSIAAAMT